MTYIPSPFYFFLSSSECYDCQSLNQLQFILQWIAICVTDQHWHQLQVSEIQLLRTVISDYMLVIGFAS